MGWVNFLIWVFHHFAQLPNPFGPIPICPSRTGQTVEHAKSKSTQLSSQTICDTLYFTEELVYLPTLHRTTVPSFSMPPLFLSPSGAHLHVSTDRIGAGRQKNVRIDSVCPKKRPTQRSNWGRSERESICCLLLLLSLSLSRSLSLSLSLSIRWTNYW